MPCGCFGGGSKKKGSSRAGSEAPPKPPKLVEEPIKEQQQIQQTVTPVCNSQPQTNVDKTDSVAPVGNGTANGDVTTPLSTTSTVDSNRSTGARSRAELYAKRREFFRPLYDVSLSSNTPNSKFSTPRGVNTLPARGKKGGFVIGDETGYFTTEGRFVPAEGRVGESAELLSSDGATSLEDSSLALPDTQFSGADARGAADRPPRPTSQPSGPAGQWDDIEDEPKDEFHMKHHQIVQTQHSPTVPLAPPPPKKVNPHFIEFQEKHHQIVNEPESHPKDPKVTQKIVEKRLTELDKLHNEIHDSYDKRAKNGPIDVDSIVEKYTEERWKKMVEMWEAEGLVVEGGIVMVDDKGNYMQREMQPKAESTPVPEKPVEVEEVLLQESQPLQKIITETTTVTSAPEVVEVEVPEASSGDVVTETVHEDGDKVIRVIESTREVKHDDDRVSVVKHTETITVEKVDGPPSTVTTVITPPTPQAVVTDEPSLTTGNDPVEISSVEDYVVEDVQAPLEQESSEHSQSDANLQNLQQQERKGSEEDLVHEEEEQGGDSSCRVSPPASPPPPQTVTPPPSPPHGGEKERSSASVVGSTVVTNGGDAPASGEVSATPPPSPPLEAAVE